MAACPVCAAANADDARFCSSCGASLTETPRVSGEERKVVSVLFVDLVGFTTSSEQADPEDVRARLRTYHARAKQEIERFGGTVEKFIGDAVMAVFGAPVAHEDDPERAVNAALRVIAAVEELDGLSVRAAINTGEAVVTLGARPAEGEAMVAGDVVNTAARLQQHAPVNGVVVGETTYRATRDLFDYEALDPVAAKGKAEPVALWHAKAARRRFGVDVEPVARTPLIGRDDDLALLQSTYARTLREGSTQLVTIVGEPGVGKTRLTTEFRGWVDDQAEIVFWRQGRSLPYGEGITYWALGEIVKGQAGILESDSPDDAHAKLAVAVGEVTGDSAEAEWLRSSLAPLVGAGDGAAAAKPDATFAAWQRFLEGVAAQHPLIAVFEDLHWADEQLLAFVEHLVDWSTSVPLLVLCTARPELYERAPGWGGGKRNSNTISLSPLGAKDTARLLSALLERTVLPAETQSRLIEHAGGNPLYAEEFVRMLGDQGLVAVDGTLREADIRVPDNVQALIAARLDTLPAERKALLHNAAVVGKVFWSGAVATMGGAEDSAVRAGLQELVRKELVRGVRESSVKDQTEYAFWHALVRDVAYSQIPRGDRIRKHVAVAEWIEDMAGDRVTDHAELLAHHYAEALELAHATGATETAAALAETARRFLELAGDRAMTLDLHRAYNYYLRAADLCAPESPERGALLLKACGGRADNFASNQRAAEEALAIFRAHGDEIREAAALVALSGFAWIRADTAQADALEREAIEKLERHPPGEELLSAYSRRAGSLAIAGRSQEALEMIERVLALLDEPRSQLAARMHQYRGIARVDFGDIDGLDDIRTGLELAREIGDLVTASTGYSNLASLTHVASVHQALAIWEEGIDFCERRGITSNMHWQLAESTWALFALGEWEELVHRTQRVHEFVAAGGAPYPSIMAALQHALVLLYRGRLSDAADILNEFVPRAREAGDPQVVHPALAAAARLAIARDDLDGALELVRELEPLTAGSGLGRFEHLPLFVSIAVAAGDEELADAYLVLTRPLDAAGVNVAMDGARAIVTEHRGESEAAAALYDRTATGAAAYGSVVARAEALLGLGRCLVNNGRAVEAEGHLDEARGIFKKLGAEPLLAETDDLLARATSRTA